MTHDEGQLLKTLFKFPGRGVGLCREPGCGAKCTEYLAIGDRYATLGLIKVNRGNYEIRLTPTAKLLKMQDKFV